ncbi:MAG: hypothetical protein ABI895_33855 [Deltaproteobacteria bacterium]
MPKRAAGIVSALPAISLSALPALTCLACAAPQIPDPRLAAQHWSEALARGDAELVYGLLSQSAQQALGREGVKQVLDRDRKELIAAAASATAVNARVETLARVTYSGERSASLVLEDGRFRIAAAAALPAHAATPEDALEELREVLARRSFAGLLRVLTADAGRALDAQLASMVDALGDPATVEIEVDGRRATARLPGGHTVKLEREDGAWRVRDFD